MSSLHVPLERLEQESSASWFAHRIPCSSKAGKTNEDWLLFLRATNPERPLLEIVRKGLRQVIEWSAREVPGAGVAANVILTNGEETVGLCLGRSRWFVE